MNWLQRKLSNLMKEESGIATVELVLILVVLIAVILLFKTQITKILNAIFAGIDQQIQGVFL